MLYLTRQLYINDKVIVDEDDEKYADEEYDLASKAYAERLEEIRHDLPKSIRKLLDDKDWNAKGSRCRYVDDKFYIAPTEDMTFLLVQGDWMFIHRYSVDDFPVVEPPPEEFLPHFDTEMLEILEEEWDIEVNGVVVHRLLLSNGYVVKFKPKEFRWWKVKVEAEA